MEAQRNLCGVRHFASGGAKIQEQVAELTVLTTLLGCLGSEIGLFWSQGLAQSRQNYFICK